MLQAEEIHVDRWEVFTIIDVNDVPRRKLISKFTRVKGRWLMHVEAGIWYSQGTVRELNDLFTKLVLKGTLK